jgi:hypothetical protein
VQRIINSSVNRRTKVAPAHLLFGNKLDLNRGILTPHLSVNTHSRSTYIEDLISVQDKVLDSAVQALKSANAKHAASNKQQTVFPIGTYVLCRYTDRPPTRLHTTWHGPYRVVSYTGAEYVLANLVTHKERSVHIKNLKIFNYDSEVDVPADTARRDYMEFVVEKVLNHAGDKKKPTTMSFQVKWLNYDDTHNSWEPWKNLRLCEALHDYLRENNMKHFIPKNLEASV